MIGLIQIKSLTFLTRPTQSRSHQRLWNSTFRVVNAGDLVTVISDNYADWALNWARFHFLVRDGGNERGRDAVHRAAHCAAFHPLNNHSIPLRYNHSSRFQNIRQWKDHPPFVCAIQCQHVTINRQISFNLACHQCDVPTVFY